MKRFAFAVALLFVGLPAFADSFEVDVLQNGQFIPMQPNGNPLLRTTGPPFELEFNVPVFITPVANPDVSMVLTIGGQVTDSFEAILDNCPPGPCGFGVALFSSIHGLTGSPNIVNGMITITVPNQTETFNFRYTTATTPEPTSLLLLGTGLIAIGWYKYHSKKFFPSHRA